MKKLALVILSLMFVATSIDAAKAVSTPKMVNQPDGTTLMVRLMGDEHCSWTQTLDGVMLIKVDGAYYIAKIDADGIVTSTGVLAHNLDSRSTSEALLAKDQNLKPFFDARIKKVSLSRAGDSGYPMGNSCPHMGHIKIPVIMMQYPDKPFVLKDANLNDMFNGTVTRPIEDAPSLRGYSSARMYFNDASNGKFDPEFVLIGPYTAKHEHDYYGHKNSYRYQELFSEAVDCAKGAGIDFSEFDSNNDNEIDLVYVLYAGTSANNRDFGDENNDIWPCCYNGYYINVNGKTIRIGGVSNELLWEANTSGAPSENAFRTGMGVFVHEMSHGLGLPDLYRFNNPKDSHGYVDYNNVGPEDWDLMDGGENINGGTWPVQYAAWEKEAMGWIETEELTEAKTITAYPLGSENGKAYKITNPNYPYEYYIIETFQTNKWNKYLASTETDGRAGLHIMHINGPQNIMIPNGEYKHPNITLLPADGYILALYAIDETIWYNNQAQKITYEMFLEDAKGDLWPGSKNVTSIADFKEYTSANMAEVCSITDITPNADGSVTFKFKGGDGGDGIITPTYTDTRESICTLSGIIISPKSASLPHGIYIINGRKVIK